MPSFESESNLNTPEVSMLTDELTAIFAQNANLAIFHQDGDYDDPLTVEVNGIYVEEGREYYVELNDTIYPESGHTTAIRVGASEYELSEEMGIIDMETGVAANEEEVMDIRFELSQTKWQSKYSSYSVDAESRE